MKHRPTTKVQNKLNKKSVFKAKQLGPLLRKQVGIEAFIRVIGGFGLETANKRR
jgi:hypothetical protein